MEIKSCIRTENGDYAIDGVIPEKEIQFLIEFAINYLVAQGIVLSYMNVNKVRQEEDDDEIIKTPPTKTIN